jgi:hypothetical protein
MEFKKPELGIEVTHQGVTYITSDEPIEDGDLVLPEWERNGLSSSGTRAWIFQATPCPMPYWGNEKACRKLVPVQQNNNCLTCRHDVPGSDGVYFCGVLDYERVMEWRTNNGLPTSANDLTKMEETSPCPGWETIEF